MCVGPGLAIRVICAEQLYQEKEFSITSIMLRLIVEYSTEHTQVNHNYTPPHPPQSSYRALIESSHRALIESSHRALIESSYRALSESSYGALSESSYGVLYELSYGEFSESSYGACESSYGACESS